MDVDLLNDFKETKTFTYKGERYSVRDNGAVFRHAREGKRKRKYDDVWTFGKPNKHNGYMYLDVEVVHRIVACAFHGNPPSSQHVVDHIDTNRRNNRPENLRWLTKFENALNNPITRKKIIYYCGSIEVFVRDPSVLNKYVDKHPNLEWMRTVSREEALNALKNLERLSRISKHNGSATSSKGMGEWLYKCNANDSDHISPSPSSPKASLIPSLTSNAMQRNWKTPTEFLLCPDSCGENGLEAYYSRLATDVKFCSNKYGDSVVSDYAYLPTGDAFLVMCKSTEENPVKPWSLLSVACQDGFYIHESISMFFSEDGAKKEMTLKLGKEWKGGNTIDDNC